MIRAAVTTTESATTIKVSTITSAFLSLTLLIQAVPLNDDLEENLHQEELRQEEEEEEKMSTTETESLGTIPTTSSTSTTSTQPPTTTQADTTSHSGFIEWAPYRGKDRKNQKKRRKVGKFLE